MNTGEDMDIADLLGNDVVCCRLVIKAASVNTKDIERAISAIHNYDLPQIISFETTGGLDKYIDWVKAP